MRLVYRAGFEVDDDHGDALPFQSRELAQSGRAGSRAVPRFTIKFRTTEAVGEVIGVEQSDLFLEEAVVGPHDTDRGKNIYIHFQINATQSFSGVQVDLP